MSDTTPTKLVDLDDLITREAAAAILGVSIIKLDYEADAGRMPAPHRIGSRCVMYSRRKIEAFRDERDAEAMSAANAKSAAAVKKSRRARVSA